jgi:hypothetical protein
MLMPMDSLGGKSVTSQRLLIRWLTFADSPMEFVRFEGRNTQGLVRMRARFRRRNRRAQ